MTSGCTIRGCLNFDGIPPLMPALVRPHVCQSPVVGDCATLLVASPKIFPEKSFPSARYRTHQSVDRDYSIHVEGVPDQFPLTPCDRAHESCQHFWRRITSTENLDDLCSKMQTDYRCRLHDYSCRFIYLDQIPRKLLPPEAQSCSTGQLDSKQWVIPTLMQLHVVRQATDSELQVLVKVNGVNETDRGPVPTGEMHRPPTSSNKVTDPSLRLVPGMHTV